MSTTALVALAAWAGAAPGHAAAPQLVPVYGGANPALVVKWVALTAAHEPGLVDAAAREALAFSPRELAGILYAVETARLPVKPVDVPDVLARGAVLHTDVAAAEMRGAQKADEASSGGLAFAHFGLAEGLVWRLASRASSHPLINAWCVAAGSVLSSQMEVAEAPAFLDRALKAFPDDPQLLLLAGAARELRASPRVQEAEDLSAATRRDLGDARQNLRRAEAFYRRALEAAPTEIESRIRLGRVLGLTGRHAEALAELETAGRRVAAGVDAGVVVDPPLQFYLALFLGEAQDASNRIDDARRSYERALELYPGASSAWLGLSRLEWRNGTRDAATAAVVRMADPHPSGRLNDDPWGDYFSAGPARDVDRKLEALASTVGGRR